MLKKNTPSTLSLQFFRLSLKPGTFKLELDTLNQFTDYKISDLTDLSIETRKIAFNHETWTLVVTLAHKTERLYIKVTATELLVSCSVDTNEKHLSHFAYCTLCSLMSSRNEYDFSDYYLPGLGCEMLQKKFLKFINSKTGLEVLLKDNYQGLFKPGTLLPEFKGDTVEIHRVNVF